MEDSVRFGAYSGDPLLVERTLAARLRALTPVERMPLSGETYTAEELATEIMTPSLFGERRALVVRHADDLVRSQRLARTLADGLPPDTALFLVGHQLRGPVVREAQEAEHFRPPKGRTLRALAKELLEEAGLPAHAVLLDLLLTCCGSGRDQETLRLAREVEKLAVWKGEKLPRDALPQLVFAAQAQPFPLLDALGSRDVPTALAELRRLVRGTSEAFPLFFMVVGHVRNLLIVRDALDRGTEPPGEPWLVRRRIAQANRFTQQEIIELLEQLQELDVKIKSGGITAPDALVYFTLSLAA